MMKTTLLFIICLMMSAVVIHAQPENNSIIYRNPVIAGDFPDPTVIRVGKMYYAAGTTSDFAPNYPLYESSDLVNWKQIGSVLTNCHRGHPTVSGHLSFIIK